MGILRTKQLYMQMCQQSSEVHEITQQEREALQAHLRKMYTDIEKVCRRHGLTVMLAYGSVLGAVRHHGFIPWDDDLDLYMPRADYEAFMKHYSKELPDNYEVYGPMSSNGATIHFGKVFDLNTRALGPGGDSSNRLNCVYVDVFPLENISEAKIKNNLRRYISLALKYIAGSVRQYEVNSSGYRRLMSGSVSARLNYWIRESIGWMMSLKSAQGWYMLQDRVFSMQKSSTGLLHDPSGWAYDWNPLPYSMFLPPKRVQFDDIEVYVPNDPLAYVNRCYGDWQQIPPPEKRWRHFIVDLNLNVNEEDT